MPKTRAPRTGIDSRFCSVEEVQEMTGLSRKAVRALHDEGGVIPTRKRGGRREYLRVAVEALASRARNDGDRDAQIVKMLRDDMLSIDRIVELTRAPFAHVKMIAATMGRAVEEPAREDDDGDRGDELRDEERASSSRLQSAIAHGPRARLRARREERARQRAAV